MDEMERLMHIFIECLVLYNCMGRNIIHFYKADPRGVFTMEIGTVKRPNRYKWLKRIGSAAAIPLAFLAAFLIYITVMDYKPAAKVELLSVGPKSADPLDANTSFTITTYNIGYAGNDQGQDFFMDGGSMSRSSSQGQTDRNLSIMADFLKTTGSDIYLLQEVDKNSSRSYGIDEVDYLSQFLPHYEHVFAANYRVPWVPVPVFKPMGKVHSGLMTSSKLSVGSNHTRYDLPGKESWPVQQMELDRAFIETRIPVSNGKELIIVNLHLSAFDKGGAIRKKQLNFLSSYIEQEMKKENYIVIGGDWNHSLPETDPAAFPSEQEWPEWLQPFPEAFTPEGFNWVVDPSIPTVRTLDRPYKEGTNFLAVIDGFLVSPNIDVAVVAGHDQKFTVSDHNPVTATMRLK
ncbi:endonuclease/exonuclease/phosphatase family protein [Paenibacillus sp. GCM10027627]|uniref:endonuclease/exonuclease/phosphatase family protein n=1 Tax=unclassified Paenibacillus TaxID=185978 RepID=UPI00362A2711